VPGSSCRLAVVATIVGALALTTATVAAARLPDDQRQARQWPLAPSAVIDVPDAWSLSQGSGVVVAVIDTGIRQDHPDLAPNLWTNPREVPGNGIDDDANGYVDDVHGIDLVPGDPAQDLSDGNGHGTMLAGVVAAAADGHGIVGVAYRARIMTIKVLDAAATGTTAQVAAGIRYAVANGARVINLSLGADEPSPDMDSALAVANAANVLVVCSAGNAGRDLDAQPSYPASVPLPNIVAVAATTPAGGGRVLAPFSNRGAAVELAAPGARVLTTSRDGGYVLAQGTSLAAPHVAGVAALAVAAQPSISAPALRAALIDNARPGAPGTTSRLVDAFATVRAVASAATLRRAARRSSTVR
jgi:subtilisin family serine protease